MVSLLDWILVILTFLFSLMSGYLWVLALGSIKNKGKISSTDHLRRFAITIPAHNEQAVIGRTLDQLHRLEYPSELFDIFVVADFCHDQTAAIAREHQAICYERNSGEGGSKGAALSWLFSRVFEKSTSYDGIVVFDADTYVHEQFLREMNDQLESGARVIQGKHIIRNPQDGWFPALTWAMMTIDNRFNNQGRSNLGLCAKHMGDSICFEKSIIKKFGWGIGLTEDYDLRLRLIENGINILYHPMAKGFGQAPIRWKDIYNQRIRWARGTIEASSKHRVHLLVEGFSSWDIRKLDGAFSLLIPPYSVMSVFSASILVILWLFPAYSWDLLTIWWTMITLGLVIYPFFGLILEKAPFWSYFAIALGPVFMIWKVWILILARLRNKKISWIRTPHSNQP